MVAGGEQLIHGVATDKAGGAGNENVCHFLDTTAEKTGETCRP